MKPRLGIAGGGLQGCEAIWLALKLGWDNVLVDARPNPPARDLAARFMHCDLVSLGDCEAAFQDCDLIVPACEDFATLNLLHDWHAKSGTPLAFHLPSWLVSRDKAASKAVFGRAGVPTPRDWPHAEFPLVAKPLSSSGSRGVRLLQNFAELTEIFPDEASRLGWIIEEYCPGLSYSIEVTGRPGDYSAWQVTDLAMDDVYDCRRVTAPTDLPPILGREFREISLAIAESLGLVGLMDVEIIASPRGLRVLEIDARLPSQTPMTVLHSTGVNILERLAAVFLPGLSAAAPRSAPRAVSYEHVEVCGGRARASGEHIMAAAGPLARREDFFGADEALTDYRPGAKRWVATLIFTGADVHEMEKRRREFFVNFPEAATKARPREAGG